MTEAVILAGGLGTRLRDAVPDLPKPMAPIHGRPFLSYQLDYWIAQGVQRFVLSVGYKKEAIISYFGSRYKNASIDYAIEEEPLGTGGGFLKAIEILKPISPFLVMNGDTFFAASLAALQEAHRQHKSDWTIAMIRADVSHRYGKLALDPHNRISSFPDEKAALGDAASGGVYLITPVVSARLPLPKSSRFSLENELLPQFLASGARCYGVFCDGPFIDIGVPDDYSRATQLLV